jgi:thiol-disulfide isomerase/thioredoxin
MSGDTPRTRPRIGRAATRRAWWIAALVGIVVLTVAIAAGFVSGGDLGGTRSEGRTAAPGEPSLDLMPKEGSGPPLSDFTLQGFGGGGRVSAADFQGTPLVLNFWASWCPFCIEEMPGFEQVHREFGGSVAFLGVDLQDDHALAKDLAARTGVTYRLAEDPDGSLFARIGGLGMPTTVLVSADGRIEQKITGPLDAEQLRQMILDNLFEEP